MPQAPKPHRITGPRKAAPKRHTREARDPAHKRGYDKRWEKFRASFLMANPLCEYCKPRGHITPAQVVDHDLPHNSDPDMFWDNTFTALCKKCHDSTKQRLERRYKGEALLRAVRAAKGLT